MECISQKTVTDFETVGNINYLLFKSKYISKKKSMSRNVYSLLCLSFCSDGEIDKDFTYDIAADKSTAYKIFNSVVNGKVTPIGVKDVLYNLL